MLSTYSGMSYNWSMSQLSVVRMEHYTVFGLLVSIGNKSFIIVFSARIIAQLLLLYLYDRNTSYSFYCELYAYFS